MLIAVPDDLRENKFQLPTFKYVEQDLTTATIRDLLPGLKFVVLRNGDMAPLTWDPAVYVNGAIVLAIQVKHTSKPDGGTPVTLDVIETERQKVPSEVPVLFIANRQTNMDEKLAAKNTIVVSKKICQTCSAFSDFTTLIFDIS